jgi:hypothetical protein
VATINNDGVKRERKFCMVASKTENCGQTEG